MSTFPWVNSTGQPAYPNNSCPLEDISLLAPDFALLCSKLLSQWVSSWKNRHIVADRVMDEPPGSQLPQQKTLACFTSSNKQKQKKVLTLQRSQACRTWLHPCRLLAGTLALEPKASEGQHMRLLELVWPLGMLLFFPWANLKLSCLVQNKPQHFCLCST
jgi:hypothetical protein